MRTMVATRQQSTPKHYFSLFLYVSFFFLLVAHGTCATAGTAPKEPFVDTQAYGSFADALKATGTEPKTLLVSSPQRISSTITIPSHVTLWFTRGGSLVVNAGVTVTIAGPVEAGPDRIFSGGGKISFAGDAVGRVYSEWWGAKADDATDSTVAIQAALDTRKDLVLLAGRYRISDTIRYRAGGQKITGEDEYKTKVRWYGKPRGLMVMMGFGGCVLENVMFDGRDVPGVNGIVLADNQNTFFQELINVYFWACRGIAINTTHGAFAANENYYQSVQIAYATIGFAINLPDHVIVNSMITHCTDAGMYASANSKVTLLGTTFSDNGWDIKMSNAEVSCYDTWFENSTGGIIREGTRGGTTFIGLYGCHLHTLTKGEYIIDLSGFTSGSFVAINNNFVSPKKINFGSPSGVESYMVRNRGLTPESYAGDYRNPDKMRMVTASYSLKPGLRGMYGPAVNIEKPGNFTTFIPGQIQVGTSGVFASNETVTARFAIEYDDGTSHQVDIAVTKDGKRWLGPEQLAGFYKDGTFIRRIRISATTSADATKVAVTVMPYLTVL